MTLVRYGMVIDLKRCVGCNACTVACKAEHGLPAGVRHIRVICGEAGTYPNAKMIFTPVSCMHCANAPCLAVCPTRATAREEGGLVTVKADKCIGCRACIVACPYQSRSFLWGFANYFGPEAPTPYEELKRPEFEQGTVVKCNFCLQRLERGEEPACVKTCIAQARTFGDLEDPAGEISRLITDAQGRVLYPEFSTMPSVYYING